MKQQSCLMKTIEMFRFLLQINNSVKIGLRFWYKFCCSFCFIFFFFKLIIFNACSPKDSQKFSMQSLPLYTPCLFSMLLSDDIAIIEKLDVICSPTIVADEFLWLILHPSFFSVKHSRSVLLINGALSGFLYWWNSNNLVCSELSWLVFVFFLQDSFWSVTDYSMQR